MRRILSTIAILLAAVFVTGTASATLIGVEQITTYPDIIFNNAGTIDYNATTNEWVMRAQDLQMVMPDGAVYDLYDFDDHIIRINITLYVDESGNYYQPLNQAGAPIYGTMTEVLREGDSITIEDHLYDATNDPLVLLSGKVEVFGWGEGLVPGDSIGDFDFLLTDMGGAFVDQGLWPTDARTGVFVDGEIGTWDGDWRNTYRYTKVKGDKAPIVPEPASLVLLGSGLAGLAAVGIKKKRNVA